MCVVLHCALLSCAFMLARFQAHSGSLTRAAFLSARNDSLAKVAIIAAGFVTVYTHSAWLKSAEELLPALAAPPLGLFHATGAAHGSRWRLPFCGRYTWIPMSRRARRCLSSSTFAGLLLAALILRALVPVGFMPAMDRGFSLKVQLCTTRGVERTVCAMARTVVALPPLPLMMRPVSTRFRARLRLHPFSLHRSISRSSSAKSPRSSSHLLPYRRSFARNLRASPALV
ncbi:MAG: cation diffusion facilitator family transporter [Gammaproteobacteria bacterium]|nr:cation diffusion facilitator family transporter [Gammaproteobacteria bacterium]